jgi:hypothetical protein
MMRLFLSCPCFGEGPKKRVGRYNTFWEFAVMVIYPAFGNGYEYNDYINRIYIKNEAGHFATLGWRVQRWRFYLTYILISMYSCDMYPSLFYVFGEELHGSRTSICRIWKVKKEWINHANPF